MTALRKVVDSNIFDKILDLPPDYKNKKVEIILFPVEEKKTTNITMAQIDEWAKTPSIKALVGALKSTELPKDINIKDIKEERLTEKYAI